MGFLNETTDVVGSKLYSAARDRGDGKPVTDTQIMGPDGKTPISKTNPLAMELTGSNKVDTKPISYDAIVSVEDTATTTVESAAFAVKRILAIYNDGDITLRVSFNNTVWHSIPAKTNAFVNTDLNVSTLYFTADVPTAFRAWGIL